MNSSAIKFFFLFFTLSSTVFLSGAYGQMEKKELIASFKSTFEGSNVGNLHLFPATAAEPGAAYPFRGTKLSKSYRVLFDEDLLSNLQHEFDAYAVYSVRHGSGNAYIIRFEGPGTQNLIGLFMIDNDELAFLRSLALYDCKNQKCLQMDSWLQDFDGDTRIDILQKAAVDQAIFPQNQENEFAQLLRQGEDGFFEEVKSMSIDMSDYRLENL